MIGAGQLDRRLVLEVPIEADDGAGGVVRGYETVTTLWASVVPKSARAAVQSDALGANVSHTIIVRVRSEVTIRHRLRDGARIYRIVSLHEDATRRFLEIAAEEQTD